MSYDAMLTITVPAALYDVARNIARALDVDVGGHLSYGPRALMTEQGVSYIPETYTTSTPCASEFKAQAIAMLADPAMLHYAVSQDYAARWADLVPPTLAECEAFCAGAVAHFWPVLAGFLPQDIHTWGLSRA